MPRDTQVGPISTKDEAQSFDQHVTTGRYDWLNPISMDRLQSAVKKKAETVILSDGHKYIIKYGYRKTYPVSKETVDSIHLHREDGTIVPRGYIDIKRIMNFRFEDK
jgi:hypothetical protein